jgi:hypothetical protein
MSVFQAFTPISRPDEVMLVSSNADVERINTISAAVGGPACWKDPTNKDYYKSRIALSMIVPNDPDFDVQTERINRGSNASKSVGTGTHATVKNSWQLPQTGTNGPAFTAVILKRQFGRAALVNDANSNGAGYLMCWLGPQLSQNGFTLQKGTTQINPLGAISNSTLVTVPLIAGTNYAPHGSVMAAGYVNGGARNFVWIDAGAGTSSINIGSMAGVNLPNTVSVSLHRAIDDEDVTVEGAQYDASGSSPWVTVPLSKSGYYTIDVENESGAQITGLTIFHAVGPVANPTIPADLSSMLAAQTKCYNIWRHLSVPDLYSNQNLAKMSALRLIGLSVQLANYENELFKNGSQVAAVVGAGEDWEQLLTNDTHIVDQSFYDTLGEFNQFEVHTAERGFFGVAKPGDGEDFVFQNILQKSPDGTLGVTQFPLVDNDDYIAYCCSINCGPNQGYPQSAFYVRSSWEYRTTTSQVENMALSNATPADLDAGVRIVANVPSFYENETHVSKIWSLVSEWAPVVGEVAKAVLPLVDPSLQKWADFAGQAGNRVGQVAGRLAKRNAAQMYGRNQYAQ